VLVKIVDWGLTKVRPDDCIITAPFTRRDDDHQLHVKFVLSFACEHAIHILKITHVAHLIALETSNTIDSSTTHPPDSRDHAIQEKQAASANHIHTNGLIRRGGPRLQQANSRARSGGRLRRTTPIQQAPKDAVKRNKHKRRRDAAHASR
jgi:hypothetical protein